MAYRTCSIEDCSRAHVARGWCLAHYRRWQRWGDPTGGYAGPGRPVGWRKVVPDAE